jgi:hypothetical protein
MADRSDGGSLRQSVIHRGYRRPQCHAGMQASDAARSGRYGCCSGRPYDSGGSRYVRSAGAVTEIIIAGGPVRTDVPGQWRVLLTRRPRRRGAIGCSSWRRGSGHRRVPHRGRGHHTAPCEWRHYRGDTRGDPSTLQAVPGSQPFGVISNAAFAGSGVVTPASSRLGAVFAAARASGRSSTTRTVLIIPPPVHRGRYSRPAIFVADRRCGCQVSANCPTRISGSSRAPGRLTV